MTFTRARLGQNIRWDKSRTLPTIGDISHFIHEGVMYAFSAKVSVPAESSVSFVAEVGSDSAHFHKELYNASLGGIEISFHEGVEFTGGTAMTGHNRDRTSTNEHAITILYGVTITDPGTTLYLLGMPSAGSQPVSASPSSNGETEEWVLAPDTAYAITITNTNGSTIDVYTAMSWYEPGQLPDV